MLRRVVESYLVRHSIVDDVLEPILEREFRKELLNSACREDEDFCVGVQSLPFPSNLGQKGISDAMKRSLLIYLVSAFPDLFTLHCLCVCLYIRYLLVYRLLFTKTAKLLYTLSIPLIVVGQRTWMTDPPCIPCSLYNAGG